MRCLPILLLTACSDYELEKHEDAAGPEEEPEEEDDDRDEDDHCEPGDPPAATAVEVDDTCLFATEPGSFTPAVEWQWSGSTGAPGYDDVMMMPAVGDVDADGMPEVVLTSYAGTDYGGAGALVILSGDGAGEEAAWTSIGGYTPMASAGVALGDIDGDGVAEIVTLTPDSRVIAVHADGTLLWVSDARPQDFYAYAYPVLADLDADGRVEVVVGRAIFDARGRWRASGAYGWGGDYCISIVVDLDGDGLQEVVVGNAAYDVDGNAIWTNGLPDGWTAAGDFDGDGDGEVATVTAGSVYLLDTDGTPLWGPVAVPGGGGGPPTIADFDGDGAPEVGVAGATGYMVVDTDGTVLWTQATTDASSARTGSSVFDFEGDGAWEVVYADEVVLWVYDGATGAPVLADTGHSSWTLFEYPVTVDVDADGETEIVLASNDSTSAGWQGITVIGDLSNSWAPSAPVWNQHAYDITNVEDDLSIPTSPVMNWLTGHNSFRAGGLREGPGNPAPNLGAVVSAPCWECDTDELDVYVQVQNTGLADVVGPIPVALYRRVAEGQPVLIAVQDADGAVAGSVSAPLVFSLTEDDLDGAVALLAAIDDDGNRTGVVIECGEDDNGAEATAPDCE